MSVQICLWLAHWAMGIEKQPRCCVTSAQLRAWSTGGARGGFIEGSRAAVCGLRGLLRVLPAWNSQPVSAHSTAGTLLPSPGSPPRGPHFTRLCIHHTRNTGLPSRGHLSNLGVGGPYILCAPAPCRCLGNLSRAFCFVHCPCYWLFLVDCLQAFVTPVFSFPLPGPLGSPFLSSASSLTLFSGSC